MAATFSCASFLTRSASSAASFAACSCSSSCSLSAATWSRRALASSIMRSSFSLSASYMSRPVANSLNDAEPMSKSMTVNLPALYMPTARLARRSCSVSICVDASSMRRWASSTAFTAASCSSSAW